MPTPVASLETALIDIPTRLWTGLFRHLCVHMRMRQPMKVIFSTNTTMHTTTIMAVLLPSESVTADVHVSHVSAKCIQCKDM